MLSAVLLGPWAGAVVIAAVLIVQCLLFGDGGLTALGANFVNAVAVFLAPFASEYDDGLEWVGGNLGFLKEGRPSWPPRCSIASSRSPAFVM